MKLNKIVLAVIASTITPLAATAGVTVSPLLLGYHYTDKAQEQQREVLRTGKELINDTANNPVNDGVALKNGLYKGAAIGIELAPSTQFQVEYGVSNTNAQASAASVAKSSAHLFEAEQQTISGNLLVGTEQFTGHTDGKFKPYVLVGGGQSNISIRNKESYTADVSVSNKPNVDDSIVNQGITIHPGNLVKQSKDIIGNVGLGARYLVNDALALRGEARAVHNFDNKWWEGLALAGLEVTLGGRLSPTVPVPPPAQVVEVVPPAVITPPPSVVIAPPPVVIPEPEPAPVVETPVVETPVPVVVTPPPVVVVEEVVNVDSDMDGVPDNMDACPGTPRNLVVDARGCPVQVNVDVVDDLRLELRVFFDNNKSIIKPQYRAEVAKVAEKMREYPNATARIEGHASKTKSSAHAYNQRLSEARANAVKSMLSNEFGIAPNRLSAVGYSYDRPIAPNNTEEGRAQNRRVYAVIEGNKTITHTVNQTVDMVIN